MSRKSKGINAERDLIHKFWLHHWAAIRVAGSGSSKYPSPDILAGNGQRRVAIECKTSKDRSKYLTKDEVSQLAYFAQLFGADPWIAVKFNHVQWYFIALPNLIEKEGSYFVNEAMLQSLGKTFEAFVNQGA